MTDFALVAPLGGLVVLAFLYMRRLSDGAAATAWGAAWLAVYVAGLLSTLDAPSRRVLLLLPVIGSLFPGLLLAGSLAFHRHRFAAWPIAAGLAIGATRSALQAAGRPDLALAVEVPLELPLTLGAAGLAWRAALERSRSLPQQLLGPTLGLLAFLNAADPLARALHVSTLPLVLGWMGTSLAAAMLQAGAFVERAREREQRLAAERDLLYRTARLATHDDPADARAQLEGIVSAAASQAGLAGIGVWLLDRSEQKLEVAARLRRIDETPDYLVQMPADDPIVRAALASDAPVTVLDLPRADEPLRRRAEALGIAETAVAPLRAEGRTFGAMVAALGPGKRFEDDDLRLLASLAGEIARVVRHTRALEDGARLAGCLDAEHRTLRALLESSPLGLLLLDREGRVALLSRAGAEHFGLGEPGDWVGRPARETYPHYQERLAPDDARRLIGHAAWNAGDGESLEVRFTSPAERRIEIARHEVRAPGGERIGRLWTSRDVTDLRQLAERRQRTRHSEMLGALTRSVARDLEEPLAALRTHAGRLLAGADLGDEARAALVELERTAAGCAERTGRLRDLARPVPPIPRAVDVEKALGELTGGLRAALAPGVRLAIEVAPGLAPVLADPAQLERALRELVANAGEAIGARGTIVLAARDARAPAGERARVAIEVRDDGCGMDERALEQVFDPLFTTKPGRGSGLGLALAFAIGEAHDAALEVESAPGRGSTFRLVWPAAAVAPGAGTAPDRAAPAARETLLLAEDEPSLRRLARMTLERRGYRVLEAEDGEAALALFTRHQADVALAVLGAVMAGRSGLDALRAMRALAPGLPAVLVNRRADPPPTFDGVRVLGKPFGPDELAQQVRAALDAGDR